MSILCHRPHRGHPPTFEHAVGFTISAPFNGRDLSLPLSFSSLPSSFHLYSLHDDDTPAMLSWQQSGPDCLVARQLTSPIRGAWRYGAGDKQITQNMCACTWLCRVWATYVWTLAAALARVVFFIQMFSFLFFCPHDTSLHVRRKVYHQS